MKRKLLILIIGSFIGISLLSRVHAFDIRNSEDVTIPKDITVNGSLFATGTNITIDGTVDGDVYCAGQRITIQGTVNGDIICAGQTIAISGNVEGNIRSAAQILDITGSVKHNITAFAQTVTLAPTAKVIGELLAAGQTMTVGGSVGRGLLGAGQTLTINGPVGGDATIYSQSISLGEKANIFGNLTYTSDEVAKESPGAVVGGKISHLLPQQTGQKGFAPTRFIGEQKPWPQNAVGAILIYLGLGLLITLFMPAQLTRVIEHMRQRPAYDMLVGFLVLIIVPIMIVVSAITIIGIPIALLLGLALALVVLVSRVFAAILAGDLILRAIGREKTSLLLQLLVGVPIAWLFFKAPILGFFLTPLAIFWGLGGIFGTFAQSRKGSK